MRAAQCAKAGLLPNETKKKKEENNKAPTATSTLELCEYEITTKHPPPAKTQPQTNNSRGKKNEWKS